MEVVGVRVTRWEAGGAVHGGAAQDGAVRGEATASLTLGSHGLVSYLCIAGGTRPFGVTCIIAGVDSDEKARVFKTEPSGLLSEWHGVAIGSNAEAAIRELAAVSVPLPDGEEKAGATSPGPPTHRVCRALHAALMKRQSREPEPGDGDGDGGSGSDDGDQMAMADIVSISSKGWRGGGREVTKSSYRVAV